MSAVVKTFNKIINCFITACKRSLRRLCFFTCLSFCPEGGEDLGRYPPGSYTPLGRYPQQVHPPRAGTPQVGTPPGMYPTHHSACWDTDNKRAARIPLECILVYHHHFCLESIEIYEPETFPNWFKFGPDLKIRQLLPSSGYVLST